MDLKQLIYSCTVGDVWKDASALQPLISEPIYQETHYQGQLMPHIRNQNCHHCKVHVYASVIKGEEIQGKTERGSHSFSIFKQL